jgi:hypothetical protein
MFRHVHYKVAALKFIDRLDPQMDHCSTLNKIRNHFSHNKSKNEHLLVISPAREKLIAMIPFTLKSPSIAIVTASNRRLHKLSRDFLSCYNCREDEDMFVWEYEEATTESMEMLRRQVQQLALFDALNKPIYTWKQVVLEFNEDRTTDIQDIRSLYGYLADFKTVIFEEAEKIVGENILQSISEEFKGRQVIFLADSFVNPTQLPVWNGKTITNNSVK